MWYILTQGGSRMRSLSLAFLLACHLANAQPTEKRRIALYDFDASTVRNSIRTEIGHDEDYGKVATQMLMGPLTQSGAYDVIDRARMKQIFTEQNLRFSDRFDPSKAAEYGRVLGVDAIITGTLDNVFVQYKDSKKGVIGIGGRKKEIRAVVESTAQMISTSTAQVVLSPSVRGENSEEVSNETSGRIPVIGRRGTTGAAEGGSGSSTQSRNPAEPLLRQALRNAMDKIAKDFVDKAATLPKRPSSLAPPKTSSGGGADGMLTGHILKVSGNMVYVNRGVGAGLKEGDSLQVRKVTDTLKDPDTGRDIQITEEVGTVSLVEVSQDWSRGTFAGKATPKAGDQINLKRTTRPAAPPTRGAAKSSAPAGAKK
jgi:curli biogenesis system outer membrane secretion channel CsgG